MVQELWKMMFLQQNVVLWKIKICMKWLSVLKLHDFNVKIIKISNMGTPSRIPSPKRLNPAHLFHYPAIFFSKVATLPTMALSRHPPRLFSPVTSCPPRSAYQRRAYDYSIICSFGLYYFDFDHITCIFLRKRRFMLRPKNPFFENAPKLLIAGALRSRPWWGVYSVLKVIYMNLAGIEMWYVFILGKFLDPPLRKDKLSLEKLNYTIAWFQVWIFKIVWEVAHRALSPDPSPLNLGLRFRFGFRFRFALSV